MLEARRPLRRIFYLLLWVLVAGAVSLAAPVTTRISDIVYRADGTPARGTLLISWPIFITANGEAVAAGTKSVTLASQGELTVDLVPNTSATPAGTFYTVVFQLDDTIAAIEAWKQQVGL